MIDAVVDVQESTLKTIQGILRALLQQGVADALLVPMVLPAGNVAPMLVTDPAALDQADPLAPILPINAARAAANLTVTGHKERLGLVLRPCEIRALVELVKFQQVKLDNAFIIGIDCLGTYPLADWQAAGDKPRLVEALLAGALSGQLAPHDGMAFRTACQICEQPLPEGDHVALTIGLVGVEPGKLYLQARDDLASPSGPGLAQALALSPNGPPPARTEATAKLTAARVQARDAAFAAFRARVNVQSDAQPRHNLDGLLQEFSTCIRCHNCMINCPICYCKECIFRTPTFEHESQLFYQWAERKGTVRLLPDTLLFHLTRLNHMVTSCVGCGMCTEVCPVDIPVGTVFRAAGERVQAIFDYHPGRSLEDPAPVQEFREDELTALGERPRS
jgi:formate dehydrogenase subunit beta